MKKIILLTLLIASFTGAQAAVSISGTILQNPVAEADSGFANPADGDTAWIVDATDIGAWAASAAAFTNYLLEGTEYVADQVFSSQVIEFFGSTSVGGQSNVELDDTAFAVIVEVASDSSYSLYTDAAALSSTWVGPAAGGTLSVSPTNGQAALYSVVVPEPSTYALLAGFAAFLFVAIRRRK